MRKITRKLLSIMFALGFFVSVIQIPTKTFAMNITPVPADTRMYTTSATPVYATPDLYAPVVIYLERFVNVTVTGITENGFYRVNLNGDFYIPGVCLVHKLQPEKTAKQKALEELDKLTEAYQIQLEMMEAYSPNFALVDVTGDGIPEIFDSKGKEIYTYYKEHAVMMYYNEYETKFYYTKDHKRLAGKYNWNNNEIWEAYYIDNSLLPWGQFRCFASNIADIAGNILPIERNYTNDASTRSNLKSTLKDIMKIEA